jgi:3-oxoadipate enol-lactonase/4-carboxymuconolactone decarboxylase
VRRGTFAVLDGAAHLVPAEAPDRVVRLVRHHFLGEPLELPSPPSVTDGEELWARPGLDRRSRSMVALSVALAGGTDEGLAAYVHAALRNGVTGEEVREVLLQAAAHLGVDAGGALETARQVLEAD